MAEVQNEGEDLGEVAPREQQSDDSEVPLSTASTSASVMRKRKCPDNGKSDVDKVINFLELNSDKADDLDLFFRSMCETTRKLPALKQIRLRRQINDLVLSAQEEVMLEQYSTMSNQGFSSAVPSPLSNQSWSSTSVTSNHPNYQPLIPIHHQNQDDIPF